MAIELLVSRERPSPKLRSTAVRVPAQLGHVQIGAHTRDSQGRPVQEFDFVDPKGRPNEVQALLVDTRTARATERLDHIDGTVFARGSIKTFEVVDGVPASIRKDAIRQK